MEIAKGIQHSDYLKLNLNDYSCPDWDTAIEYFKKRINERFIEPIRILIESESDKQAIEKKYGFTILAIDFMLIETIQSFIEGKTETKSKSKKVFKRFLRKRKNFKDYFKTDKEAEDFYHNFRCGILHQSQTFGDTKVWTVGELIRKSGKYTIVNRELFHKKVESEFENYVMNLEKKSDKNLLKKFKVKMDFIVGK